MKKIIFLMFFALAYFYGNAQSLSFPSEAPNYNAIKADIEDPSSSYYYAKLLPRLMANDTTLNNQDYRHLYYGYIYQKKYQPYWMSPTEKEMAKYYSNKELDAKDYDEVIRLCKLSIEDFPFDLRSMNYLAYIYHLKGDEETSKKLGFGFRSVIETILSTGDGKTCETGYHVISGAHEYAVLNHFQLDVQRQSLDGNCDFMQLSRNDRNITGLYFNVKSLFDKNSEIIDNK